MSDTWFGYSTPRQNQLSLDMERTACTTYEGDLFLKKLRLTLGLSVDVDDNLIGKFNRLMGYVNYEGFSLRVQSSTLRGTAEWNGEAVAGMPGEYVFDNPLVSVDLLRYTDRDGIDYFGIGYTSYRLPVQLDCLIYDTTRGEVWWAPQGAVYQPDMAFGIYSLLFGVDTLHEAFAMTGIMASMQGFRPWMATQDRVGVGLSHISDEARTWVETANSVDTPRTLWSTEQIAMLVDYDLTLGMQWVGDLGQLRLGFGIGFNIGGQVVMCITPRAPVEAGYVDASPSLYIFHYGPILRAVASW
ncbi:MAG: hypothetical protein SVR04_08430 [Spirochaetota bacterium]|nr:hypothetical protein [Spirochaetota bacterium]